MWQENVPLSRNSSLGYPGCLHSYPVHTSVDCTLTRHNCTSHRIFHRMFHRMLLWTPTDFSHRPKQPHATLPFNSLFPEKISLKGAQISSLEQWRGKSEFVCDLKPSACTPPPANTRSGSGLPVAQLKTYPQNAAHALSSSPGSAAAFDTASSAEVASSNPTEERVRIPRSQVRTQPGLCLFFETHKFRTERRNDLRQLHDLVNLK